MGKMLMLKEEGCLFQQRCGAEAVTVNRGATIYMPEQRASFVYHLHSGVVGLFDTSPAGLERMPVLVVPPHFIGFASFVGMEGGQRHDHITEARAITSAVYCKSKREAVWALMDDRKARAEIFDMVYGLMLSVGTLTAAPFKHGTVGKVLTLLQNLAERVGEAGPNGQTVIRGVSHDELATMVGSTRPTVTRILGCLEARGLLTTSWRSITVPDPTALHTLSKMI